MLMLQVCQSDEECEKLKSLSGQVATPEQKKDLRSFWDNVGHDRFANPNIPISYNLTESIVCHQILMINNR